MPMTDSYMKGMSMAVMVGILEDSQIRRGRLRVLLKGTLDQRIGNW